MFCMLAANSGEPQSKLKEKWPERDARELAVYLSHEITIEQRLDLWFSQVVAVLANMFRKKGKAAVAPKDLIPEWWGEQSVERTNQDWVDFLKGMALGMGGKVIDDGGEHRQSGDRD